MIMLAGTVVWSRHEQATGHPKMEFKINNGGCVRSFCKTEDQAFAVCMARYHRLSDKIDLDFLSGSIPVDAGFGMRCQENNLLSRSRFPDPAGEFYFGELRHLW